jgi:hypothetical protein
VVSKRSDEKSPPPIISGIEDIEAEEKIKQKYIEEAPQ